MFELINQNDISLLLRLFIAHLITDFLLQKKTWIFQRREKKYKSVFLYVHGLIAGILIYLFSGLWNIIWLPVIIAITHILIDIWKSYKKDTATYFIIDQLLHFIVIIICWIFYINIEINIIQIFNSLIPDVIFWTIILSYIIVIWPSGFLISTISKLWIKDLKTENGLKNAGKWIGWLERILILTFILLKFYTGIGFLIAAKSILRFGNIKDPDNRKEAEYILIGTMLSFVIAIFTGIFAQWIINFYGN